MRVILVTGGFDPLHSGHISYFQDAKKLGDILVVGLNSDDWLSRKKGRPLMSWDERACVLHALRDVDMVTHFDDGDDTSLGAITQIRNKFPDSQIIFANGGDRTQDNVPESNTYLGPNVEFAYGVGGKDKKNSSSLILKNWQAPKTERPWGHYRNLYEGDGFRVKELVINPHSALSMQKHQHRSETWNLVSGEAYITTDTGILDLDTPQVIPKDTWHQGYNLTDEPAHIVEIWQGDILTEDDIEWIDDETKIC